MAVRPFDVPHQFARNDLRVPEHLRDVVDRCRRYARLVEQILALVHCPAGESPGHQRIQDFRVLKPRSISDEARVTGHLGHRHRFAKSPELLVVTDDQHHLSVDASITVAWESSRQAIPQTLWNDASIKVTHAKIGQRRHLHVQQRHVDVLSQSGHMPFVDRGKDGNRRIKRGQLIGDRHPGLSGAAARRTVGITGNAHEAAQRLHDRVVARPLGVRPGLAEAGDRAIDQPRIDRLQDFKIEPVARKRSYLVVLDQHIRLRNQAQDQFAAHFIREVGGNRTLSTVA